MRWRGLSKGLSATTPLQRYSNSCGWEAMETVVLGVRKRARHGGRVAVGDKKRIMKRDT